MKCSTLLVEYRACLLFHRNLVKKENACRIVYRAGIESVLYQKYSCGSIPFSPMVIQVDGRSVQQPLL